MKLENSPIIIRLEDEPPSSRRRFMGYAPASCSFWRFGIDSTFYTFDGDHNCSIGKVIHGLREAAEVKDNDDVKLLTSIGWLSMEDISKLPRLPRKAAISYIPVDMLEGDVVPGNDLDLITFFCNAEQVMLVVDAAERAGIEYRIRSRPTCAILGEAYLMKGIVIGLGCTPSRLRTPYSANDLFVAIHPSIVGRLIEHLRQVVKVEEYLHANKAMLLG
uniref:Hypothetical conserved protein n=1 Tax=uncultured crenarchaeote TaxID=29281 RepID=H5SVX8_9CREN|nr:hypothetical conserved protein [uncultured crenarchaeote]